MAKNRKNNDNDEPNTAPEPDRWYNLSLGSSFVDHRPSPKFCTLRYEFKPASIDKNQPGSFHKSKDNRVTVEFHNNQQGKPKVTFEGVSEDYKEHDAVLFFDGESFRLERLHRAVKRLRHLRLPGESAAPAASVTSTSISAPESYSPPSGGKGAKLQSLNKDVLPHMPVEVKGIDINNSESIAPGPTSEADKDFDCPPSLPNPPAASPDAQPRSDEMDEEVDVVIDDDDDDDDVGNETTGKGKSPVNEFHTGIDINIPHPGDLDDEIADVDVDDVVDNVPNAAEALRAQVNAEVGRKQTSSSSDSSGSESSGSESGSGSGSGSESESASSSSDTESSEGGDSVNSI
ncbi:PREDICTED: ELL-associated factor [Prunus dulcis]|uniref:PREDICTED: ELL-associated factor n=1 Tax=Prunus dulcis TaxID=3755 RepID=A0A5E4FL31_PRUDU|nr:ELL-associated factor 1 isoform X1 [Prunus dulcis]VVA28522.1 PREDICTED: ELL-associated factor [Prunus dulcis]